MISCAEAPAQKRTTSMRTLLFPASPSVLLATSLNEGRTSVVAEPRSKVFCNGNAVGTLTALVEVHVIGDVIPFGVRAELRLQIVGGVIEADVMARCDFSHGRCDDVVEPASLASEMLQMGMMNIDEAVGTPNPGQNGSGQIL